MAKIALESFLPLDYDLVIITAQKMKFSFRISSVNVTKSAPSWGFGHVY